MKHFDKIQKQNNAIPTRSVSGYPANVSGRNIKQSTRSKLTLNLNVDKRKHRRCLAGFEGIGLNASPIQKRVSFAEQEDAAKISQGCTCLKVG